MFSGRGKSFLGWIFGGERESNTLLEEDDSSSTQQIGSKLETSATIPRSSTDRLDVPIPMIEFVKGNYKDNFKWDTRLQDKVAAEVGLTEKHKVFPAYDDVCLPDCGPFERQLDRPKLGTVHSTVVYAVRPPTSIKEFKKVLALKVIRCENSKRRDALQEVKNMAPVEHWHIVAYIASFEQFYVGKERRTKVVDGIRKKVDVQVVKEYNLGIAMYPAGECDLVKYIELAMENYPDERCGYMHGFFGCLSQAVSYLHNRRIRLKHKDIKPGNIIIDSFNQPLLTDFGISKHYIKGEASKSDGYTYKTDKYACAQSTDEKERDYRSDVYSLGCVFLEMVTVILGKKLSELEQFRGAKDDKPAYCKTLPQIYKWLEKLETDALKVEDNHSFSVVVPILGKIKTMLSEDLRPRPWADQLWPCFANLYIFDEKGDLKSNSTPCSPCEQQNTNILAHGIPERRDTTLSSEKQNLDIRIKSADIPTSIPVGTPNGTRNSYTPD